MQKITRMHVCRYGTVTAWYDQTLLCINCNTNISVIIINKFIGLIVETTIKFWK